MGSQQKMDQLGIALMTQRWAALISAWKGDPDLLTDLNSQMVKGTFLQLAWTSATMKGRVLNSGSKNQVTKLKLFFILSKILHYGQKSKYEIWD